MYRDAMSFWKAEIAEGLSGLPPPFGRRVVWRSSLHLSPPADPPRPLDAPTASSSESPVLTGMSPGFPCSVPAGSSTGPDPGSDHVKGSAIGSSY